MAVHANNRCLSWRLDAWRVVRQSNACGNRFFHVHRFSISVLGVSTPQIWSRRRETILAKLNACERTGLLLLRCRELPQISDTDLFFGPTMIVLVALSNGVKTVFISGLKPCRGESAGVAAARVAAEAAATYAFTVPDRSAAFRPLHRSQISNLRGFLQTHRNVQRVSGVNAAPHRLRGGHGKHIRSHLGCRRGRHLVT